MNLLCCAVCSAVPPQSCEKELFVCAANQNIAGRISGINICLKRRNATTRARDPGKTVAQAWRGLWAIFGLGGAGVARACPVTP
eukprot:gene15837-biopygen5224